MLINGWLTHVTTFIAWITSAAFNIHNNDRFKPPHPWNHVWGWNMLAELEWLCFRWPWSQMAATTDSNYIIAGIKSMIWMYLDCLASFLRDLGALSEWNVLMQYTCKCCGQSRQHANQNNQSTLENRKHTIKKEGETHPEDGDSYCRRPLLFFPHSAGCAQWSKLWLDFLFWGTRSWILMSDTLQVFWERLNEQEPCYSSAVLSPDSLRRGRCSCSASKSVDLGCGLCGSLDGLFVLWSACVCVCACLFLVCL